MDTRATSAASKLTNSNVAVADSNSNEYSHLTSSHDVIPISKVTTYGQIDSQSSSNSYMVCPAPRNSIYQSYSRANIADYNQTTTSNDYESPTSAYYFNDSPIQMSQEQYSYTSGSCSNQYYGYPNQTVYPVKRLSSLSKNVECR